MLLQAVCVFVGRAVQYVCIISSWAIFLSLDLEVLLLVYGIEAGITFIGTHTCMHARTHTHTHAHTHTHTHTHDTGKEVSRPLEVIEHEDDVKKKQLSDQSSSTRESEVVELGVEAGTEEEVKPSPRQYGESAVNQETKDCLTP